MRSYPALDVETSDLESLLVLVDDLEPVAAEEQGRSVTIYFSNASQRDRARDAVAAAWPATPLTIREVDDGDWAARSQQNLTAVTVGRVTVAPPWAIPDFPNAAPGSLAPPVVVVVQPSMGFGTGHHATTRLCLAALQTIDLVGKSVLDLGTGSGVLAMAASRLGAASAIGIDNDPDAIQAAGENLPLNPGLHGVSFRVAALESLEDPDSKAVLPRRADVLTANLTGALLIRSAPLLLRSVQPEGLVIVSGLLDHERDEVISAFGKAMPLWESSEEGWVALVLKSL